VKNVLQGSIEAEEKRPVRSNRSGQILAVFRTLFPKFLLLQAHILSYLMDSCSLHLPLSPLLRAAMDFGREGPSASLLPWTAFSAQIHNFLKDL
jgi:hypothetical protein